MVIMNMTMRRIVLWSIPIIFAMPRAANAELSRVYRIALRTQDVEIPFILALPDVRPAVSAAVINGTERIEVPVVQETPEQIVLHFPHYESKISLRATEGSMLAGTWEKRSRDGSMITIEATGSRVSPAGSDERFPRSYQITEEIVSTSPIAGRWAVKFGSEGQPAVGIFNKHRGNAVEGTFLTNGGDYRYLAGSYEHGLLRLSCFDGSHAFLFHARMQSDGTLKGDFWSGAKWHETWTAKRDENAQLSDGFTLAKWKGKADFAAMKFNDMKGAETSLKSLVDGGKGVLIEIFGSWCPNCHDASAYLVELEKKYRGRGLRVVGLAFEYSGKFDRDVKQVGHFAELHKVTYPLLIAGKADKAEAAIKLPMLDRVPAYPTFIFAKPDGTIVAVYSGFSGPATGAEFETLKQRFEREIEGLLGQD